MNLRDLRTILTTSDASEWSRLTKDGPYYRNGFIVSGGFGEDAEHDVNVTFHHDSAVYRQDIDLTIQWGMALDEERDRRDEWHFLWSEKLIASKVYPHLLDVFWRGVLVDRYVLASVDNAHGLIPLPHTKSHGDPLDSDAKYYDAVTEREVAVTRLIDDLQGGFHRVDEYLGRLDVRVLPDAD